MEKIKALWLGFESKNPKIAKWVCEGGLFLIVSTLITVFKFLLLTFLPYAFSFMGSADFGFPGVDLTLFGIEFKWYIIGYGADQGGAAYFTAYILHRQQDHLPRGRGGKALRSRLRIKQKAVQFVVARLFLWINYYCFSASDCIYLCMVSATTLL